MPWFGTGGNSSLRPESAQSITASIAFDPLPDVSLSATYFHTVFGQRIQAVDLSANALDDSRNDWLVTRNIGSVERRQVCDRSQFAGLSDDCLNADVSALVDLRLHNAETLKTDGIDVMGRFPVNTRFGKLTLGLESNYVLRYAEAPTPTSPIASLLNQPHYPRGFSRAGQYRLGRA